MIRGFIRIGRLEIDGHKVIENYAEEFSIVDSGKPRIGLVGCSSQKALRPCPAKELYTSQLFRAARAYAEATCDRWYILSAKFGLLEPSRLVDPYDQVLTQRGASTWGVTVGAQLDRAVPWPKEADAELVVLAGSLYADAIATPGDVKHPRDFNWSEPLRGLGIGQRLRWLQQNTPRTS